MNRAPSRLLNLLLCALLLTLTSSPAWAMSRPENRVWENFSSPLKSAAKIASQPVDTRPENPGYGYDFASGVHKYLYCQDNPVNGTDPSGHDMIEVLVVMTVVAIVAESFVGCSPSKSSATHTDSAGVILTGAEPVYNPGLWNSSSYKDVNNCYAYAVNNPVPFPTRTDTPQPGYKALGTYASLANITVSEIKSRSVADGLLFLGTTPSSTSATPRADYVVALVVDPGTPDYHWYRHGPDGMWSSKHGRLQADNVDSSGNVISDPHTANRNYGSLNYSDWGGYFAVPPGMQVR